MEYQYAVSSLKPTAVSHSLACSFTSPAAQNLLVAKCTHLELYDITRDGLQQLLDIPIYGRIAGLEAVRLPGDDFDHIFLSTEDNVFCLLGYDPEGEEIVTKAAGDATSEVARIASTGHMVAVDPEARMIVLRIYEGQLKVIPVREDNKLGEAFDIRCSIDVIDLKFLHGCEAPTLAMISVDPDGRNMNVLRVNVASKELEQVLEVPDVDVEARHLIPIPSPVGGVVVVGQTAMQYASLSGAKVNTPVDRAMVSCVGQVDPVGRRFLLGDEQGNVLLLVLEVEHSVVKAMNVERLGNTSVASSLTYLDEGVVYLGSAWGDSHLLQLSAEPLDNGSFIEILDTYCNVGPIVDFCVVDLAKQGQSQLVTCSGNGADGSLRLVTNGLGVWEKASSEMPGVEGLWPLRSEEGVVETIAISFSEQTAFLSITGEEWEGKEVAGAAAASASLYCGNMAGGKWLQVTSESARVIDAASGTLVQELALPDNKPIGLCAANRTQLLLVNGQVVSHYKLVEDNLVPAGSITMKHEVSCVDVTPGVDSASSGLAVVGLWTDISVCVIDLGGMEVVAKEGIGGDVILRSVLMADLEGGDTHLLCASGDGSLFTFGLRRDTAELTKGKRVNIGTQPIQLRPFTHEGKPHVFATSDRPTVIHASNHKLLFSNVNLPEVSHMCPVDNAAYEGCIAVVGSDQLTLAGIEVTAANLQIQKIPVGELVSRIAYQSSSGCFCLLTEKSQAYTVDPPPAYIRLCEDKMFELTDRFDLEADEMGMSVLSHRFEPEGQEFFVVGTAIARAGQDEPQEGRILVFRVSENKLVLDTQTSTEGAVHSMVSLGDRICAGVNSQLLIFSQHRDESGSSALKVDCGHYGHILTLFLKSKNGKVLVGDLMRSMSVHTVQEDGAFVELTVARGGKLAGDQAANWMSAVEFLDEDNYLGAESCFNLFTCRFLGDASNPEERSNLETTGVFHLGDQVNVLRPGSLAMRTRDMPVNDKSTLYGTIGGGIGTVISLSFEDYSFFKELETRLNTVISGVGGFQHSTWRSFRNERRRGTADGARNFVDGDLVERFLDLSEEKQSEVVDGFQVGGKDGAKKPISRLEVAQRVSDMSRMH